MRQAAGEIDKNKLLYNLKAKDTQICSLVYKFYFHFTQISCSEEHKFPSMEHFVFYRLCNMIIKRSSDSCRPSFVRDLSTKIRYDQIVNNLTLSGRNGLYLPDILHILSYSIYIYIYIYIYICL
jgi:hypothetical protein